MSLTLDHLIQNTTTLFSLPEVCVRVNHLVDDPESSAAAIGQVIEQDAGLSTRLLKIVNSPFYGFPSRITTISRAITIIGTRDLRDLILATATATTFSELHRDLPNMDDFWRHSLYTAVIARHLAEQRHELQTERFFVAGLLHDIGLLVLFQHAPELSQQIRTLANDNGGFLHHAEQAMLGFTHADVGAELAAKWGLPDNLVETIGCHHAPAQAINYPLDVAIVHLANFIATLVDQEHAFNTDLTPLDPCVWGITGLNPEDIDSCLNDVQGRVHEMFDLLFPRGKAA